VVKNFLVILNYVFIVTVYAVMVVDIPSSGKAFHPLLINCSPAANVQLQTADEHVSPPASELQNCSGLFRLNFKLEMLSADYVLTAVDSWFFFFSGMHH